MRMAMPVKMAMTVESMQCTAKAAICRGATLNEAPVRAARSIWNASGTAIDARHKTHRYRANRRGTHHGQDDTAGTFHAITCACRLEEAWESQALTFKPLAFRLGIEADLRSADKPKPAVSRHRAEGGQWVWCQPPPEKCDVNACATEPNPPRVTPLEPESDDVADEEWLDESPLKKLLRDDDPPDEPWLLLDDDPRGGHSAWVCSPDGAAIPGRFGSQLSLGISA
jgi:hypothetical protein